MATQLSTSQQQILSHAIEHTEGKITWFPENIKGGARKKVLTAMHNRALITPMSGDWFATAEAYDALNVRRLGPVTRERLDELIALAETAQHGASQVLADEVGAGDPTDAEIKASNDVDPVTQPTPAVPAIEAKAPRTRENSKQATVIAMLRRPEGATNAQICEATGWLSHTTRGFMAGSLKKKLGLEVNSAKDSGKGAERIYFLPA